jgi:predicted phage terminase large subunit-like protein
LNELNLTPQTLIAIEAELGKRSFYKFVEMCWSIVEPETPWKPGFHIKLMCDYAQACFEGKVRNLIVNVPLRHAKSLIFCVFFPAWCWTLKPYKKFLYSSYAQDLAIKHSIQCRDLILSDFYQSHWPLQLSKDQNQKEQFKNVKGGFRFCYGSGGQVTGNGGNFLICDDPLKPSDINSENIREGVNDWYDSSFSNRLVDPSTAVRIVLMQRLHNSDLTGHLLEKKTIKWEQLVLPARYEGKRYTSSIGIEDPRIIEGEPLWPEVYGEKELSELSGNMSELQISGQLQQRPSTIKGNIFKRDYFNYRFTTVPTILARYQSWDTASSVNTNKSAYSACVTGELDNEYKLHIIDVYRDRLEFTDLNEKAEELAEKWKYKLKKIIIEEKSTGQSLIYALKKSSKKWMNNLIQPYSPIMDKDSRCFQNALWCSLGMIVLPDYREWLFDFEEELFNIGQTKYRDQTDAFNQLVIYLQSYLELGHNKLLKQKGG